MLPKIFPSLIQLVKSCPNTRFILNHMAKPDVSGAKWELLKDWEKRIEELSKFSNIYCKLSGFYAGNLLAFGLF